MERRSLWVATAAAGPQLEPLSADLRADVAIVGGGYTGLTAALHLSEAGRDVVLIEAADIGARASGLNGGQVIPGVKHDPDMLEEMFGPELGPRIVRTVASGPDLLFELIRTHQIACDATRAGWIQPATSEEALGMIRARAEQWRRRGAPVELLDARAVSRLIGSNRYCGGWLDRRGGSVQPLAYARGLAFAAIAAGARVFNRSPVHRLERSRGGGWRLDSTRGSVTSAQVILATGAYTDRLSNILRRTQVAIPSFQVATTPLSDSLRKSILPEGQAASDTWHLLRYFRLDATGRLIMGSRGAFGNAPVAATARHHYRAVREIFPQLEGIQYEYHWGGFVGMTRDHLPHLHDVAPGVQAALGYNGRGVAMATVLGRLMGRRVLEQDRSELEYPISPISPIPLHVFSGIGARLAIQYLRAIDGVVRWRNRRARLLDPLQRPS